jgi:hypothetical protein
MCRTESYVQNRKVGASTSVTKLAFDITRTKEISETQKGNTVMNASLIHHRNLTPCSLLRISWTVAFFLIVRWRSS